MRTDPGSANLANRWLTSVRKYATVWGQCNSLNISTWRSDVAGPILPLRSLVAHRDDPYRVQSLNSALVERMLWPGLGSGGHIMFPDFCQSVLLAFGQRTHISHDHHSRGQCCSSASISYDVPCMGVISYQKTFASALNGQHISGHLVSQS